MTNDKKLEELILFRPGGVSYMGLEEAQEFFKTYVDNVDNPEKAFLWLCEEIGELGRIIRTQKKNRYKDGIGDVLMWMFSLAQMLDVRVSQALEYSTQQLVAKGYTKLAATGKIDRPLDLE
jgi:NTP pyrophosphatase (non-canonical NTP hydrolase)